ncbi:MAG: hypothetical protein FJ086_16845 [Deltaproteobacteria bacterium]|nr:hypothetical protein [Deltaproteobacteria bacterium]
MKPWHEDRGAPGRWGGGSYYGERDRQEPPAFPGRPKMPGHAPTGALPLHLLLEPVPLSSWRDREGIGDASGLGTGWGRGEGNVELGEHWDAPSLPPAVKTEN